MKKLWLLGLGLLLSVTAYAGEAEDLEEEQRESAAASISLTEFMKDLNIIDKEGKNELRRSPAFVGKIRVAESSDREVQEPSPIADELRQGASDFVEIVKQAPSDFSKFVGTVGGTGMTVVGKGFTKGLENGGETIEDSRSWLVKLFKSGDQEYTFEADSHEAVSGR